MNDRFIKIIKVFSFIFLFGFSIFCFALNFVSNYEIYLPIGLISLFSSFLVSPLFEWLCKKRNKQFTIVQKIIMMYGMIMVIHFYSILTIAKLESFLSYILNVILNIIIIFILLFALNRQKYDEITKFTSKKSISFIVISIIIINAPLINFKSKCLEEYYDTINRYRAEETLDTIKINSNKMNFKEINFEKLHFRDDFENYLPYEKFSEVYVLKNELGEIESTLYVEEDFASYVYFRMTTDESHEIAGVYLPLFYKKNNLSSQGKTFEYMQNKKLNIFNSLNDVVFSYIYIHLSITPNVEKYQKIELDNGVVVYYFYTDNDGEHKIHFLNANYNDNAYNIKLTSKTKDMFSEEYIMDFIKTISIK